MVALTKHSRRSGDWVVRGRICAGWIAIQYLDSVWQRVKAFCEGVDQPLAERATRGPRWRDFAQRKHYRDRPRRQLRPCCRRPRRFKFEDWDFPPGHEREEIRDLKALRELWRRENRTADVWVVNARTRMYVHRVGHLWDGELRDMVACSWFWRPTLVEETSRCIRVMLQPGLLAQLRHGFRLEAWTYAVYRPAQG